MALSEDNAQCIRMTPRYRNTRYTFGFVIAP